MIAARETFGRRMLRWAFSRLVFIDESGVNLSQTRAEARAPRGERVVDHVPGRRWETYSIIAGLRSTGIIAPMVIAGAMNAEALRVWVEKELAPRLRPGDIVVWDNLGIHTDPDIASVIKKRGARLQFLPPYSPEFNPIEEAWSKMKGILRAAKARTVDTLVQAVGDALRAISRSDCRGWFTHAGYVVT